MKRKSLYQIFLVFFFVLSFFLPSHAQNHKYFIISGKVMVDSVNLKNCSIEISRKDRKAIISPISTQGRFRLELDYNSEYRLTFRISEGYSKVVAVNTCIPLNWTENAENLPHFLMAVRLFGEEQGLVAPVQEILFSPDQNRFTRANTAFDYETVEKGSTKKNPWFREQIDKSKALGYQIF